ncbi:MAG: PAS domain S-box protein [Phycisphaerae bacterium]|jgi:PAS domain S-box-containing protein|nr:PAS domain S-box protein [Phycisphaerae bacterium]
MSDKHDSSQESSDLRNAQQELLASRDKCSDLYDSALVGYVTVDDNGIIVEANLTLAALLGLERRALMQTPLFAIVVDEDQDTCRQYHRELLKTRNRHVCELRLRRGDESRFWVHMDGVAEDVSDDGGAHVRLVVTDITGQKQAEDTLRLAKERFEQMAEHGREWIWEVDADGLYTYASPVVEKILGYSPDEIVGKKHFYDLFHPEQRQEMKTAAFEVFARRESFRGFVNRNSHKNGQAVWLSTSGVPLLDEDGDLAGYRGADTDITEQKQAEEALKNSHNLMRTMLEGISDPIFLKDLEGRYILLNTATARGLGRSSVDEVIGTDDTAHIPARQARDIQDTDRRVMASGESEDLLETIEVAGNERSYRTTKFPYHDEEGNVLGVIGIARDITEQKQAEEALRASEKNFRTVFEQAGDYILVLEPKPDGSPVIIDANQAAIEKHGYTRDELIGTPISRLVDEANAKRSAERVKRLTAGEHLVFESIHIRKDGTAFPVEVSAKCLDVGEGRPLIMSIERDITERKQATDALEYRLEFERIVSEISSEFVRCGIDKVDDVILRGLQNIGEFTDAGRAYVFLLRDDGVLIDNTHEWCAEGVEPQIGNLEGIAMDEELPWFAEQIREHEVFHAPDVGALPAEAKLEKAHFEEQDIQSLIVTPMIHEADLVGFLGFDSVGEKRIWSQDTRSLLQFVGQIFTNALRRKWAEQSLRETESELKHLVAVVPGVIATANAHTGYLTHCNPALSKILGFSSEELLARPFIQFIHPDDRQRTIDIVQEQLKGSPVAGFENRYLCKDGSYKWLEWRATGTDEQGVIYAAATDTTERKSAEVELAKHREHLEELVRDRTAVIEAQRKQVLEASRLKSEFLATMSHELRTPLNSILALSELMLSSGTGRDPGKESEFLTVIERNGRQLLDLINDILNLSSIEAGQTRIACREFEPRAVLADTLEIIRPLAQAKGLSIETRIADVATMCSDRDRLRQILLNLLSNAVKFTESGQVTVVVSESTDSVSFEVTDTGIGISPDILPDIFDHFRQADGSSTRAYGGTGLGLAIAQKLAVLLGGEITVRSEVGVGSTFALVLPARIAEAPDAADRESIKGIPDETKGASVEGQPTGVILIVEDNADNLLATRATLEQIGYACRTATDGRGAVAAVRADRPALVLMDIQLPEMDGLEATRRIKADEALRDIPVIALTAKAMTGDREEILAAGCDDYMSKPISVADLESMLAKWLG